MIENESFGKIYLIPTFIGNRLAEKNFPPYNIQIVNGLNYFAVENQKAARKFIKEILPSKSQQKLNLFLLDKKSSSEDIELILASIKKGNNFGVLSEAGMPGIADPGAELVKLAYQNNIKVEALIGPSSISLAMAASGLNGQYFTFHGYLPVEKNELRKKIGHIISVSQKENSSHIFIETPYRNNALLEVLLSVCPSNILLCLACEITDEKESIKTQTISKWKKKPPDLHKKPCIFILQA